MECRFNITIKISSENPLKNNTIIEERCLHDITIYTLSSFYNYRINNLNVKSNTSTTSTTTINTDIDHPVNNSNYNTNNATTINNSNTKNMNSVDKNMNIADSNTTTTIDTTIFDKNNLFDKFILVFIKNYTFKPIVLNEKFHSFLIDQIDNYSFSEHLFTVDEIKNLLIKKIAYDNDSNSTISNTIDTITNNINQNSTNLYIEYTLFNCYGITFNIEEKHLECFFPHWSNIDIKKLISTINLLNEKFTVPDNYKRSTNIQRFSITLSIGLLLEVKKKNVTDNTLSQLITMNDIQISNDSPISNSTIANDYIPNLYKETYEVSMIYPFKKSKNLTLVKTFTHIERFPNFNQFRRALVLLMRNSF